MSVSIYRQLGPGQRIALSKLSIEHYEKCGRPLRVAIDISIWDYQTQLGEGGSNPVLRTFYYRLLRLLGLGIRPLFVFDGPQKPAVKRNQERGYYGYSIANALSKQLLRLVGFPFHVAPGEAEAECALLQKEGIVDAVLSEDVDTLMFGCGVLLRNWSSEVTKGNSEPTHVNMYVAEDIIEKSGLTSNGMILVALMSGGDYDPDGIPGCGPIIACEAAKAGFADELLKLATDDEAGLQAWRDWLKHELDTNEGGYFGCRHKSVLIPQNFPRKDILALYSNPVVSTKEQVRNLSASLSWNKPIDIPGLRKFVADAFQWSKLWGANKFIRTIAPKLVVYELWRMGEEGCSESDDLTDKELREATLIRAICGQRNHVVTDGQSELRIAYVPADIVGLDLDQEECDDDAKISKASGPECLDSDSENPGLPTTPSTSRSRTRYDPGEPERIWILESFVKLGVPLMWETWTEDQRKPKLFATRKAREKKALAKGCMRSGALDAYVKVSKFGALRQPLNDLPGSSLKRCDQAPSAETTQKADTRPATNRAVSSIRDKKVQAVRKYQASSKTLTLKDSSKAHQIAPGGDLSASSTTRPTTNPWILSKRPSDTFDIQLPPGTRYSALGIYPSENEDGTATSIATEKRIEKEPLVDVSPRTPQKHVRPLSASSIDRNITVRRKTKKKPLARAHTAPSGAADVIDLTSPAQSPHSRCTDKSDPEFLQNHNNDTVSRTTKAFHIQASENSAILDLDAYAGRESREAQKVSRRLDFGIEASLVDASPSNVNLSPSPPDFLLQSRERDSDRQEPYVAFLRTSPSPTKGRRRTGRLIMLRDSLEGKWRDAEPSDRRRRQARVFSSVGVLDLTGTP